MLPAEQIKKDPPPGSLRSPPSPPLAYARGGRETETAPSLGRNERGVERLLGVPLGVEVLGFRDRLPGEGEPVRGFLAPAVFLLVVGIDEGHHRLDAVDAVV